MGKRSAQLGRILKVQLQLRREAEASLGRLNARRAFLENMEVELVTSRGAGDPRDSALAAMAGDRLRWLERDLKENEGARSSCEARWRKLAQSSLATERLQDQARALEMKEDERRSLEDILAQAELARTSLP